MPSRRLLSSALHEGEEPDHKEKLKTKWAAPEATGGAEKRIDLVAEDLVKHWDARLEVMDGKAMIVCMSRRICNELYEAIRQLRPEWNHKDDDKSVMKIMWLPGFDAPSLHTRYVDKTMRSHGPHAGARAREPRFQGQAGQLGDELSRPRSEVEEALAVYTESGGTGETAIDQEEAVAAMRMHYERGCAFA